MSVVFDRIGRNGRRRFLVAACLLAAAMSPASAQSGSSGAVTTIMLDQAQVMKLPAGVATLVVGNPLIADVSIQPGGMVVLTGKGYGVTNLIAFDRSGAMLEQKTLRVQGARDSVTVYRGAERESYNCTPNCERRITLGDGADFFNATLGQAVNRNVQAQGAAAAEPSK
jgi:Flp pilus assembly secretin CpaC